MTNDREHVFWPFVIVVILALGVATLTVVSSSRPKIIINAGEVRAPTPTATKGGLNIRIISLSPTCGADPVDPSLYPGTHVCFTNTLGESVYLEFEKPQYIVDNTPGIPIDPKETECITVKEHIMDPLPIDLSYIIYIIKDGKKVRCSADEGPQRPKIIILPPL